MTRRYLGLPSVLLACFLVAACQQDESENIEDAPPALATEAIPVGWVNSERLANADAEPENWLTTLQNYEAIAIRG